MNDDLYRDMCVRAAPCVCFFVCMCVCGPPKPLGHTPGTHYEFEQRSVAICLGVRQQYVGAVGADNHS